MHFDYYYRVGANWDETATQNTRHHLVLMPTLYLFTAPMFDTMPTGTSLNFENSDMFTKYLPRAQSYAEACFGAEHMKKMHFSTNNSWNGDTISSSWTTNPRSVCLPTAHQINGTFDYIQLYESMPFAAVTLAHKEKCLTTGNENYAWCRGFIKGSTTKMYVAFLNVQGIMSTRDVTSTYAVMDGERKISSCSQ